MPAIAQEVTERYRSVTANADGIGKTYMGRQIAHVMGWQGAAWLEREEREREERSDLLLRILALAPGMTVADVGAGTGYYSRRIADVVGPTGKVYAVDVQPEMVAMLQSVAKQRRYDHVKPVLGGINASAGMGTHGQRSTLAACSDIPTKVEPRLCLRTFVNRTEPNVDFDACRLRARVHANARELERTVA
jgi:SAM-dependent methyltransferase